MAPALTKVEKHDIYKKVAEALRTAVTDSELGATELPEHKEEKPYKLFGIFKLSNETCSKPWVRGLIAAPACILAAAGYGCLLSGIAAPAAVPLLAASVATAAAAGVTIKDMNDHLNQPKNEVDQILKSLDALGSKDKAEVLEKFKESNPTLITSLEKISEQEEKKEGGFFAGLKQDLKQLGRKLYTIMKPSNIWKSAMDPDYRVEFEPRITASDILKRLSPTEEATAEVGNGTELKENAAAMEEAAAVAVNLQENVTTSSNHEPEEGGYSHQSRVGDDGSRGSSSGNFR